MEPELCLHHLWGSQGLGSEFGTSAANVPQVFAATETRRQGSEFGIQSLGNIMGSFERGQGISEGYWWNTVAGEIDTRL